MNTEKIINLWLRDQGYGEPASQEQQLLPENPVGAFDLVEDELTEVVGGDKGSPATASLDPSFIVCCVAN